MDPSPTSLPGIQNVGYAEELLAAYQRDPESVPESWREYFSNLNGGQRTATPLRLGPSFRAPSLFHANGRNRHRPESRQVDNDAAGFQDNLNQLIRNYRVRGHNIARIDPLGRERPCPDELDPAFYGFTDHDMDRPVYSSIFQYEGELTLGELIGHLRQTYCRSIGVQFMHIDDMAVRRWLAARMEGTGNRLELQRKEQLRILTRLTDAVTFEEFIRKKFIGAKSFSLEGCESLLPLLDLAIEYAGEQDVREIVMGMAHRGRLNVLANILGKNPREIFREFEDKDPHLYRGRGDVKYHLGYSNDWETLAGKRIHLSLCFNPSHLEFVNPVVMGRVRAKQDRVEDNNQERAMALLIHGDASFAGEGIVQETLNMSQLPAYRIGGTLHVVVNNQIGFTTPPEEGRSSIYATGVARLLQIPIFHVNGEDPEAVAQVVRLAMDYRREFRSDVVIDMYGYRRMGHNEADEPGFTQPVLYDAINKRKSVREGYLDHLLQMGGIDRDEADQIAEKRRQRLEDELSEARDTDYRHRRQQPRGIWSRSHFVGGPEKDVADVDTGWSRQGLVRLLKKLTTLPKDFHPHKKILKGVEDRKAMAKGEQPLDWSAAEALALGSLATDGVRIRLTGQDSARGTFSQRHAILHDVENGQKHIPLCHVDRDQAPVEIRNSPLSENGVLGFEYGYSLDCPDGLVMWEAQFGDFVNVAQAIIDQFIASAEDKWNRLSGLVMLLPHGFEGMGPEHSSARLERFLNLAAEDNLQIVYPTTAGQYFHLLRRQVLRRWRKPLIVMTPKSLLRHSDSYASLEECADGRFHRVIDDPATLEKPDQVKRILLCSGKIFYELQKAREEKEREDIAIVRLEQLYPLRLRDLEDALNPYPKETPVYWVQEEPENMGAWWFLKVKFGDRFLDRFPLHHIARRASASPASGSTQAHKLEQQEIIDAAFGSDS